MENRNKLDNLTYRGEETGYLYLGNQEEIALTDEFLDLVKKGVEKGDIAKGLKENTRGGLEDYVYEEGDCDGIASVEQKVIYYNPVLNTSLVFKVIGDHCCDNLGFDSIPELLEDIQGGINSIYSHMQVDKEAEDELMEYLMLEDTHILVEYVNAEYVWGDVKIYKGILKGVTVRGIRDIPQDIPLDIDVISLRER